MALLSSLSSDISFSMSFWLKSLKSGEFSAIFDAIPASISSVGVFLKKSTKRAFGPVYFLSVSAYIKVKLFKTKHSRYDGQLLGCNIESFPGVDAFLYIGDGMFHPKALVMKNNKSVFIYNPFNNKITKIDMKDIEKIIKKERAGYVRFLSSENIGVLISTKHGQNDYKKALNLSKKYPKKEFYFLAYDTIDFGDLENYPFIDVFVNTACPRIGLDDSLNLTKPIINLEKVL